MNQYRVNNIKPDTYVVEMLIPATNSWLGVSTFTALPDAVTDIRRRQATDNFVPKLYDSNGSLLASS